MPRSLSLAVPQTYAALRAAVMTVVKQGRGEIENAWVKTYHDTGRLIHEHILLKQNRAGYGAGVFDRLAADTGKPSAWTNTPRPIGMTNDGP